MDIIEKLLDLQRQATLERSHYYVAACITEAIQEIIELRKQNICVGRGYTTQIILNKEECNAYE